VDVQDASASPNGKGKISLKNGLESTQLVVIDGTCQVNDFYKLPRVEDIECPNLRGGNECGPIEVGAGRNLKIALQFRLAWVWCSADHLPLKRSGPNKRPFNILVTLLPTWTSLLLLLLLLLLVLA
jgi:hypothetical protein